MHSPTAKSRMSPEQTIRLEDGEDVTEWILLPPHKLFDGTRPDKGENDVSCLSAIAVMLRRCPLVCSFPHLSDTVPLASAM